MASDQGLQGTGVKAPNLRRRRWVVSAQRLGSQVCVSVLATLCVSALFALAPAQMRVPGLGDTDKAAQRLPAGEIATTVLRVDPAQSALLASLASFKPMASPAQPTPAAQPDTPVSLAKAASRQAAIIVLPPPRPTLSASVTPAPSATAMTSTIAPNVSQSWTIASIAIPKPSLPSVTLPKVSLPNVTLPQGTLRTVADLGGTSRDTVMRSGQTAWRVSTEAVRQVGAWGDALVRMAHVTLF